MQVQESLKSQLVGNVQRLHQQQQLSPYLGFHLHHHHCFHLNHYQLEEISVHGSGMRRSKECAEAKSLHDPDKHGNSVRS
jgi:hypothetical protein